MTTPTDATHDFAGDVDKSVALIRGLTAPREQRHAEMPLGTSCWFVGVEMEWYWIA